MAKLKKETSHEMGLHQEQLKGRTQQKFFSIDESANLTYFHSFEVDTNKSATIDAIDMTPREINREIRAVNGKRYWRHYCRQPYVKTWCWCWHLKPP